MNIGIWELLLILAIVVLLFGTKKLKNLGGDVGSAIRSFRDAMKEEPVTHASSPSNDPTGAAASKPENDKA